MASKDIFCNAPWFELQIYWDGSLGFCCEASHKIYPEHQSSVYNVKKMSIAEWFNSEPMRRARLALLGDAEYSMCSKCQFAESVSGTSRRHRCNQKSVIFTKENFRDSFAQSPHEFAFAYSKSHNGTWPELPVDLHIDLGNYCNLACKMCNAQASSKIAAQEIKWGASIPNYVDWTRDDEVWNRVVNEIAGIKSLTNVHFMGGETLITSRFGDFVDAMQARGRTDLSFSFVTNGTVFDEGLLAKLKNFKRVGIEVSVETLTDHNSYQRQGTDMAVLMANLGRYIDICNGSSVTITMRPAVSALTIGYYYTLLEYCLDNQLLLKPLNVIDPRFMRVDVLPTEVRSQYKLAYLALLDRVGVFDTVDFNESNPSEYRRVIAAQCQACLVLLDAPEPENIEGLQKSLVQHCSKWDRVYGLDALALYPELRKMFQTHGYSTSL